MSESDLAAAHQQALVFDGGLHVAGFTGSAEFALAIRGGLVRLSDPATIITRNGTRTLAVPAGTDARVTPHFEIAGSFAVFDRPMVMAHLTKSTLSPRLLVEYAWRRESRFRSTGLLAQFENPEWGYVVRTMLDGIQISDKRTDGAKNTMFA